MYTYYLERKIAYVLDAELSRRAGQFTVPIRYCTVERNPCGHQGYLGTYLPMYCLRLLHNQSRVGLCPAQVVCTMVLGIT